MRAAVVKAWPAMADLYEGRCWWMYLDTKRLVTTGLGILLETVGEAQTYVWRRVSDAGEATDAEVAAEYARVRKLTALAKLGGFAYRPSAKLRLSDAQIDAGLWETTNRFWARLAEHWPRLELWPADAQLAALDLIWQNGPDLTEVKRLGLYVWPNMRAAFHAQDWERAAAAVPGSGPRAERRAKLFRNAAEVARLGLDREKLWDKTTPTPEPLAPVNPPEPGRRAPNAGRRDEWVLVDPSGAIVPGSKRDGIHWVTTRAREMHLEAGRLFAAAGGGKPPAITQGGKRPATRYSAGTHGREAIDYATGTWSSRRAKLWELCLWQVGFASWRRSRIAALWEAHTHALPKGGDLSDDADGQVKQFYNGHNALAGRSAGTYARIRELGVGRWTWEDYLSTFGVDLSQLEAALATRKTITDARELQWALARHLGADLPIDGDPGPMTKAALAKVPGATLADKLARLGLSVKE